MLKDLLPLDNFKLSYFKGWDEAQELKESLEQNLKDLRYGFTSIGPQIWELISKFRLAKTWRQMFYQEDSKNFW